jgi:hypothetical protein
LADSVLLEIDALLRARGRYAVSASEIPWRRLIAMAAFGSFTYGLAMGLFDVRLIQSLYAGVKVPLLLAVATLICLPNYYAINAVLGLAADFPVAIRGVLAAQATLALTLASLAPFILLIYASSNSYHFVMACNGVLFAIATGSGQLRLLAHYRPLIARNPRHRIALAGWLALYVFVAIQTAWVFRPYVGFSGAPTTFFREGAWDNAYVVLARDLIGHFLR